jgi:hypothetical protein
MLSVFQKTEDKMHQSADDVSSKFAYTSFNLCLRIHHAITTMIFSNLGF